MSVARRVIDSFAPVLATLIVAGCTVTDSTPATMDSSSPPRPVRESGLPSASPEILAEVELPVSEVVPPFQEAAAFEGALRVVSGCLVAESSGSIVVTIWPPNWSLRMADTAVVVVDETGEDYATVGDEIAVSGGYSEQDFGLSPRCEAARNEFSAAVFLVQSTAGP